MAQQDKNKESLSKDPTKNEVEEVFNRIIPTLSKYISVDDENAETNWFGWGGLGLFLIGAGGFLGYQVQTHDASASSVLLDSVISKEKQRMKPKASVSPSITSSSSSSSASLSGVNAKPHPFIKPSAAVTAANAKKVVEGPVSVAQVAVKALGIATVYAVSAFSLSMFGLAMVCGVHSKDDAMEKLNQLKSWGPQARKRFLNSLAIGETKNQKDSEDELKEVSHLSTEEQFEKIFTKHAVAADAEEAAKAVAQTK